jgi:hypothetical protein
MSTDANAAAAAAAADAATKTAADAAAKTAADAAAAKGGDKGAQGAPESYTFAKLKTTTKGADGKDVVTESDAPAEITKEIGDYAKEHGLTQKQAQALLDRELKLIDDASVADKEAQEKGLAALKKKWNDEARVDKEIGGDKFDENLAVGKRALAKFFPGIAKEANSHPFLDHPEVLRGLLNIGKLLSPDGEFVTGKSNEGPRDPAKVLFPNMN